MKLQPALIFGEHMVLQRDREIKIWGIGAENDTITVQLADRTVSAQVIEGDWMAVFEPMSACFQTEIIITSQLTGEQICFHDVAIGEVWLAGGQSNMEFIMKYDRSFPETALTENDDYLRYFCYPQANFKGFLETDSKPDMGFWRKWDTNDNRLHFSAVGGYMGMVLRKKLNVPVAVIGCNWGGSPAAAWTAREDLLADPVFKKILDWHQEAVDNTDWPAYIAASEKKIIQTEEQKQFNDRFMMGEDMSEFFKNFDPSKLPKLDYAPFNPGPRSVVRPSGLYESMLCKVAPYGIRGAIWYQGEDDDAREWQDFYDVSMKTLINSWRKLWGYEFPFFQIELAPFRGIGPTGAKKYPLMRDMQAKAALETKDVFDICILDAGEEFNIHPRNKKTVGNRLAQSVLKHAYGFSDRIYDCPRINSAERDGNVITISFTDCAEGLKICGDLYRELKVTGESELNYDYEIDGDKLIIKGEFETEEKITVEYCHTNWCVAVIYNSEDNPAYGFVCEV